MVAFIIILGIGVYPLLLSGWASNSKYAVIGSLRGVAQTISYEISLALIMISISIICLRFNFSADFAANDFSASFRKALNFFILPILIKVEVCFTKSQSVY